MNYLKLSFILIFSFILILCFQSCEPDGGDDIIECEDEDGGDDDNSTARKPNIYIYPEQNIELSINIEFPQGGEVIQSIPFYGDGWKINVDTNGIINDTYNFLFYESRQPDVWQREEGLVINNSELEDFFVGNMKMFGFRGTEITDFIEYWIPKFDSAFYLIYPQTSDIIDPVIEVNFSNPPDNFLRIFYVVEGYNSLPDKKLTEPLGNSDFVRKGYFATEWGIVVD